MKSIMIKACLLLAGTFILGACTKTYDCNCSSTGSSTGQIKAISKSKAQTRCSDNGGCPGGTITAD